MRKLFLIGFLAPILFSPNSYADNAPLAFPSVSMKEACIYWMSVPKSDISSLAKDIADGSCQRELYSMFTVLQMENLICPFNDFNTKSLSLLVSDFVKANSEYASKMPISEFSFDLIRNTFPCKPGTR